MKCCGYEWLETFQNTVRVPNELDIVHCVCIRVQSIVVVLFIAYRTREDIRSNRNLN